MPRYLSILSLAALAAATGTGADHRSVPSILDFSLAERERDLAKKLGPPEHLSAGNSYRTLDYLLGPEERNDEDYDWTFYFEKPSGALVSITRNFATPARVDALFARDNLVSYKNLYDSSAPLPALARVVPGDRVLIAIGLTKPDLPCSQLVLMRRSAVARFYPWIEKDLVAIIP